MQRLNLITPKEAAEALGESEQTLASWRRSGRHDLRYFKLGRLIRYDADDIQALLESLESTGEIDDEDDDTEYDD